MSFEYRALFTTTKAAPVVTVAPHRSQSFGLCLLSRFKQTCESAAYDVSPYSTWYYGFGAQLILQHANVGD